MKILVRTPDYKFAVFAANHFEFEYWDVELPRQLQFLHDEVWPGISPALMDEEYKMAIDDRPYARGVAWDEHPLGLGRWEHAIRGIALDTSLDNLRHELKLMNLGSYAIPAYIVAEATEQEALQQKKRREEEAWLARMNHKAIVDSTADETVWKEI